MAAPGRKEIITREQLESLLARGLKNYQIADELHVKRSSITKALKRYGLSKKKGSNSQENSSLINADEQPESDLTRTLFELNTQSLKEMSIILKELATAKQGEKGKLRDTYTKLSQEIRQQIRDLTTLSEGLNDRQVIYEFFSGVADAIRQEVPLEIRKKIFERILSLRNAYGKMPEIKKSLIDEDEGTGNE
jgi:predicted transcriptional regulator